MTLKEIEESDKVFLTPDDIGGLVGTPNTIRTQAQQDQKKLGFPVVVMGSRVRIPREGFLFFIKYGRPLMTTEQRNKFDLL